MIPTPTQIYNFTKEGKLTRKEFFLWFNEALTKSNKKGYSKGYVSGLNSGYSSGRHDGKNAIRSNY